MLTQYDVGEPIVYECEDVDGSDLDISTATLLKLHVRKPGGAVVSFDAVLAPEISICALKYVTTSASDLNVHGTTWGAQPYVEMPGRKFRGEFKSFSVERAVSDVP